MSASTRTVQQQTLGTGQLGTALAVVALAIIVAAGIAFGSLGAPKATVTSPAVGAPPPAVIDHGWSQAGTSTGTPYTPVDHGSSEKSMPGYAGPSSSDIDAADHGARDDLAIGVAPKTGYRGDPGYAPRTIDVVRAGGNGSRFAQ
jgi:hypothetical protein